LITGTCPLQLTPEQLGAARACGCAFIPTPSVDALAPAEAEGESSARNGRRAGTAKPRKAKAPPSVSVQPNPDTAPAAEAADAPLEAADMLAGVQALQTRGPGARVVGGQRAGQPPSPRWAIAGKIRRGRIK
jgi:hypothetical protein